MRTDKELCADKKQKQRQKRANALEFPSNP